LSRGRIAMGRVRRHATLSAARNVGCQALLPRSVEGTNTQRFEETRKSRPNGRAGTAMCRQPDPDRVPLRTMPMPGCHGGRDAVWGPGPEGGRRSREQRGRRPSIVPRATALLGRRWVAGGGPEGRRRRNPGPRPQPYPWP
jgi:hypothetical protein